MAEAQSRAKAIHETFCQNRDRAGLQTGMTQFVACLVCILMIALVALSEQPNLPPKEFPPPKGRKLVVILFGNEFLIAYLCPNKGIAFTQLEQKCSGHVIQR